VTAGLATATTVNNQGMHAFSDLLGCVINLGELDAQAGVGEGDRRLRSFQDLSLEAELFTDVEELHSEVGVVDRAANGGQVVNNGL
jgi:hypothetical protein